MNVNDYETMPTPKQRHTGLWIPAEIENLKEISVVQKWLLALIDSLYDEEYGGCFASNNFLAEKMDLHVRKIQEHLAELRKHNLIEDVSFDGRLRVIRSLINKKVDEIQKKRVTPDMPKSAGGYAEIGMSLHIIENTVENNNSLVAPDVAQLVDIFLNKIIERQPKFKKPSSLAKWNEAMDRMLRIDGRTKDEILRAINWIHQDSFWKSNILSPDKLRKQYDQIQAKMDAERDQEIVRKNREWVLKVKDHYKEELKSLRFDAKFVSLPETGKEIPFNLPEKQFQNAFASMVGGDLHD